jgi:hypothetical protein
LCHKSAQGPDDGHSLTAKILEVDFAAKAFGLSGHEFGQAK